MGTPSCIAPEVAIGTRRVDSRADIYGLGCVAYWLLTGAEVFTANTPMGVILAHVQSMPEPPSRRTEIQIPAALDDLIMACLAKNPDDRPATADQLARQLTEAITGSAWGLDDAHEWWSAHHPSQEVPEPEVGSDASIIAPVRTDTFSTVSPPAVLTVARPGPGL